MDNQVFSGVTGLVLFGFIVLTVLGTVSALFILVLSVLESLIDKIFKLRIKLTKLISFLDFLVDRSKLQSLFGVDGEFTQLRLGYILIVILLTVLLIAAYILGLTNLAYEYFTILKYVVGSFIISAVIFVLVSRFVSRGAEEG